MGAKSIFKEVVVVVVIPGRGRRNQRQRDALRDGIHTDASLMCDQAERQRTSVERGWALSSSPQSALSTPRTPLHLFIAQ